MKCLRALTPAVLLLIALACSRDRAHAPADTVGASAASVALLPPFAPTNGWPAALGRVLLVSTDSVSGATLVAPQLTDSTLDPASLSPDAYRGMRVTLFSTTGAVGHGIVVPAASPARDSARAECNTWPMVRVANRTSATGWVVALSSDSLRVLPLTASPATDSAARTAAIMRLARSFPHDTSAALRGIPFELRDVRQLVTAPGDTSWIATLERHLNQEALPLAEELIAVLESDSTGHLAVRYAERASGAEDEVETTDAVMAFVVSGDASPLLLLRHDFSDGVTFTLLRRDTRGSPWVARWNSAYIGC